MALQVGSRLGHYDVTALIGEGGMGQVYQATDTNLDRQVAIKVLPDAFASDADRLARFEREAKVLASLNHPNIGAIYGLEKSGDTRSRAGTVPKLFPRWTALRTGRSRNPLTRKEKKWRRRPDLNRGWRFCRPLPYRLATAPSSKDGDSGKKNGAGNGIRTRDFDLGKVALYH